MVLVFYDPFVTFPVDPNSDMIPLFHDPLPCRLNNNMHEESIFHILGTIKSSSLFHTSRTQELDNEYPSSQKCVGSYELYLTHTLRHIPISEI